MCKLCPDGWTHVSCPTPEPNLSTNLPDINAKLSWVKYFNRVRTGTYRWERVEGSFAVQGNCGESFTFTGAFEISQSDSHTINIGYLFNLPPSQETFELSGGYTYSFGSGQGVGAGIEQTIEGKENYEYLVVPIVLTFTICDTWERTGIPWYHLPSDTDSLDPKDFALSVTECTRPLYLRGGLLVCRRWCGEGPEPGTEQASFDDLRETFRDLYERYAGSFDEAIESYIPTDTEMESEHEHSRSIWRSLRDWFGN